MGKISTKLTHVCRGWRDLFISRSSLWTGLNFTNIDKTLTFIRRSQSSPLKFYIGEYDVLDDALALGIPHIFRIKSLTIESWRLRLISILRHFHCHTPLLEKLDIKLSNPFDTRDLDATIPNWDISSLRELHLNRVATNLPWKNLVNLRILTLISHRRSYETTQILDFLESTPLLHTVFLRYPFQNPSDAPPERTVRLRHIKALTIVAEPRNANPPHLALIRHLHIPIGASLISEFDSPHGESPFLEYLPERCPNLSNLSDITTINLLFGSCSEPSSMRLSGPSGSLYASTSWEDRIYSWVNHKFLYVGDKAILESLDRKSVV